MSSTLEASVFMGKNYSDNLHSIKNTGENLTLKQMFEISEQLILEQSDEIFGVKYIDVSRTTHTNLDVKQEKRIDDYWNIDGSRDLSDYWTGFTQFTLLEEKLPDGCMWSAVRLTKRQATSRGDHLFCWKKNLQTDICGPERD